MGIANCCCGSAEICIYPHEATVGSVFRTAWQDRLADAPSDSFIWAFKQIKSDSSGVGCPLPYAWVCGGSNLCYAPPQPYAFGMSLKFASLATSPYGVSVAPGGSVTGDQAYEAAASCLTQGSFFRKHWYDDVGTISGSVRGYQVVDGVSDMTGNWGSPNPFTCPPPDDDFLPSDVGGSIVFTPENTKNTTVYDAPVTWRSGGGVLGSVHTGDLFTVAAVYKPFKFEVTPCGGGDPRTIYTSEDISGTTGYINDEFACYEAPEAPSDLLSDEWYGQPLDAWAAVADCADDHCSPPYVLYYLARCFVGLGTAGTPLYKSTDVLMGTVLVQLTGDDQPYCYAIAEAAGDPSGYPVFPSSTLVDGCEDTACPRVCKLVPCAGEPDATTRYVWTVDATMVAGVILTTIPGQPATKYTATIEHAHAPDDGELPAWTASTCPATGGGCFTLSGDGNSYYTSSGLPAVGDCVAINAIGATPATRGVVATSTPGSDPTCGFMGINATGEITNPAPVRYVVGFTCPISGFFSSAPAVGSWWDFSGNCCQVTSVSGPTCVQPFGSHPQSAFTGPFASSSCT